VIRSGWGKAPLRRLLLVSAAVLIPALAGCEAGNNAPTIDFHQPTDAAAAVAGDIAVRNVFILGAPLGSSLQPGQSASLFFALVNSGQPDRLLAISAPGSATSVRLPGGGIPVAHLRPVLFTGPQPQAYLVNLIRTLTSGSAIKLILHFQNEGQVTLQVPVMAQAANLTTLSPPPSPSPSPTAGTAAHRHHKGLPAPTVTIPPSPTPTPSPSAS
jgi:copper(I)-binding protein